MADQIIDLEAEVHTAGYLSWLPDSIISQGFLFQFPEQPGKKLTVPFVSHADNEERRIIFGPDHTKQELTSSTTALALGGGATLYLPSSGSALIYPALTPNSDSEDYSPLDEDRLHSFSGTDMRVLIEPIFNDGRAKNKQLIELTTLTVSVHREKSPVRAVGYINPKAFARGRRTIAGTMIVTQFTVDVMYRFLSGRVDPRDASKDSFFLKADQLPPFNMTLMFCDEYGHASYRRLLGVDVVTDGTVYSVNDMMTEQTITYMASDFTPLMPLRRSVLFEPSETVKAEMSPTGLVKKLDPVADMAELNSNATLADLAAILGESADAGGV